jgi:hypothetical protein
MDPYFYRTHPSLYLNPERKDFNRLVGVGPLTPTLQSTCVLHPETVEGPYYIRNEMIRTDLRETQPYV